MNSVANGIQEHFFGRAQNQNSIENVESIEKTAYDKSGFVGLGRLENSGCFANR